MKKPSTMQDRRPTIGLLVAGAKFAAHPFIVNLRSGVTDVARERDANLQVFFVTEDVDRVSHTFLDLERLDGLLIWASTVQSLPTPDLRDKLARHAARVPMVSLGNATAIQDIARASVMVDGYPGMREAIAHLIEVHGCRRIAYLGVDAEKATRRKLAYHDVLAEHDLPVEDDLVVSMVGDTREKEGAKETVRAFLKRDVEFDAIAANRDTIAWAAIDLLQQRGKRVPVVGFDDQEESRYVSPPITTARYPIYQMARQGTEMVLDLVAGGEVDAEVWVSSDLIVRQSCGCLAPAVRAAGLPDEAAAPEDVPSDPAVPKAQIVSEMVQAANGSLEAVGDDWADHLLAVFLDESTGEARGDFLPELDGWLQQVLLAGGDIGACQNVLSALLHHAVPYLGDDGRRSRAVHLLEQGRVEIGELMQRHQGARHLEAQKQARRRREVEGKLLTSLSVDRLTGILAQDLPDLGIREGYFFLYENPARPEERSRLLVSFVDGARLEPGSAGHAFPTEQLMPAGLWDPARRYSLVIQPLYIQDEQLGFMVLEEADVPPETYPILQVRVSSALKGALLVQQEEQRARQLQTAAEVSRTVTGVLDMYKLLQRVVDLVQQRFDLYYVGLFLVSDEPDSGWASLKAASGEIGQRMLAQEHKLEIGGESMIGGCIADRQPRIAQDVEGAIETRFDNPLLPETRSEMALPLTTRDGVIGALTVQSRERNAFADEDVAVFETLAGQLANAIVNARLYTRVRMDLAERERAQEALAKRAVQLQTAAEVSQAVSSILDPGELAQQVVDLIRARFDLYYVGLFQVESAPEMAGVEGRSWAVLQAGTGSAGRRLYKQGHQLLVGGESMVGQCVATKQARIALDVGEEAVRFHNPLLPDTRSELALPLISRGVAIGALSVQSTEESAFSDEDVTVLQTMASQVANALENARLLKQTQETLEEIKAIQRQRTRQSWDDYIRRHEE